MTEAELLEAIGKATREGARSLDLSRKGIKIIPPEIANLTSLTRLDLSYNQITEIPEAIGKLSSLTELDLNHNQVSEIPEAIGKLSSLTELDLRHNQITYIPEEIGELSSLTMLDLSGNEITYIPEEIGELSSLTLFGITNNEITEIPEAIGKLSSLTELYLNENIITKIPEAIGKLSSLTHVELWNNQITEIPEAIAQLTNLQHLNLRSNQISIIPEAIAQLINLQQLDLSSNQISVIPPEIAQLIDLQQLDLSSNQISIIPPEIAQLTNLQRLYLGGNQISIIPPEIAQLTNLQWLYLRDNQISIIPPEIAQLTNLQELTFYVNQISDIPEAIAQLTCLQALSFGGNQISDIPKAITQLTNLQKLDLSNNQIMKIPDSLSNLTSLEELYLGENPLPIPVEILDDHNNPAAILSYWQKLKQGERKPLNEAKVILVGRGDVGKTSLVKQLIDNEFNENEPKTEGIKIREWQVSARKENVRLRVWDFGGQEIMHATHQFFLTERSLYVLVLNTRKDERISDVEYWLKLIQTFGKDAPILIVGNKCDETGFDLDEKGLRDKYGENIKQFIPTSCKDGTGIETLRQEIIQQIAQMDHVFDLLPQQWFAVKTKLEQSQADYIPYYEYQQLCQQEKITDRTEQSRLIKLLHDLGIILNFQDDPRLKDTNVLKPDWVTGGVYKILNNNELLTEHKGRLEWKTCQSILAADCYHQDQEKLFILDMMKKFKLSFPLDTTPDIPTYLIPDLLPKSEPYTGEWQDTLNFEYHYPILPNSIISRFTVEMYQFIFMQTFWRTGVILRFEDSKAYIKADLEDAKIFIRISGNPATRRSFLSALRTTFTKIHHTISALKVDERVPLPDNPQVTVSYEHLLSLERRGKTEYCPEGSDRDYNIRDLLDGVEERRSSSSNPERYGNTYNIYGSTGQIITGTLQAQGKNIGTQENRFNPNSDPEPRATSEIKPIKSILLLAANPKNTHPLRLQEEERDIKERLRLNGYGTEPIKSAGAVRLRDIQQTLLDFNPQIIHFSGHGGGEDGLAFEEIDGTLKLTEGEALAELFELFSDRLECVVLNACYSEVQAQEIVQHINYVIGMDRSIKDRAAIEFAVGFYGAIGAGKDYGHAFKMGCNAIHLAGIDEHHTPKLLRKV